MKVLALKSHRYIFAVLACLTIFLTALGIYLIQRDLQVLVSQRQQSLEQSLSAAKALLLESGSNWNLNTKDLQNEDLKSAQVRLSQVLLELQLKGRLAIARAEPGLLQILASTDPAWRLERLTPGERQILFENGKFSSDIEKKSDGRRILTAQVLSRPNEQVLILDSQENAFFYQSWGFVLNSLFILLGLVFIGGLGAYFLRTAFFKKAKRMQTLFDSLYDESRQAAFFVDHKFRLIDANPLALESFKVVADDVLGHSLSEKLAITPLEMNWAEFFKKLSKDQAFRVRIKLVLENDQINYFQLKAFPTETGFMILMDALPKNWIRKLDDSSFFDELTQLPKIQYLESLFETQRERFYSQTHSLMMIELLMDKSSENEVLPLFTKTLKDHFRKMDLILQFNRKSFAVALAGSDLENTYRMAREIPAMIQESTHPAIKMLNVNIGVAELSGEDSCADWLSRAEAALLTAKSFGPNRIEAQRKDEIEILDAEAPVHLDDLIAESLESEAAPTSKPS